MTALAKTDLSRRWFLAASAGGIATGFLPRGLRAEVPVITAATGGYSPTVWFVIESDGTILVHVAYAEMGQHVGTGVARIIAEELEADWAQVRIVHVDLDPKYGYMITGGSWSMNHAYLPMSQAGAAGRIALIEAGAALLKADPKACTARNSAVHAGSKSVSYGEIVASGTATRSFTEKELAALRPKPAAERRLLNRDTVASDIPAKVNGTAIFGIDRKVEGMVHARPVMPPTRYGCTITGWSDAKAKSVPGYLQTVAIDDPTQTCQGWLVVVAETWPAAARAVDLIEVSYLTSPAARQGEEAILAEGLRLVNDPEAGALYYASGDMAAVAGEAVHEAVYITHTAVQMPLEPLNAVAWQEGEIWHLHGSDQHPSGIAPLLAQALQVAPEKIALHSSYLGGGFGRRLHSDFMVPAALTAKAVGRPVKLLFSRSDDTRFFQPRSPTVQRVRTTTKADGSLGSFGYWGAAAWPTKGQHPEYLSPAFDKKAKLDLFAISGADHWYDAPNQTIRTICNEVAQGVFLPGYLRSVAPGYVFFALETHIDEVAHRLGRDPADYRLSLLRGQGRNAGEGANDVGGAARLKAVLERIIAKTDWSRRKSLPEGEGLGLAIASGQERTMPTWSATVAHVAVTRATGEVQVRKLTSVVDAGTLVHPNGALAQVEGGMLWGLSLALHEGTEIRDGVPKDLNFDSYRPVRMPDVPEIEVEFIKSDEVPVGLGEPGVITVGPAIGNAIFAATGARLRELPFRPDAILRAMEV